MLLIPTANVLTPHAESPLMIYAISVCLFLCLFTSKYVIYRIFGPIFFLPLSRRRNYIHNLFSLAPQKLERLKCTCQRIHPSRAIKNTPNSTNQSDSLFLHSYYSSRHTFNHFRSLFNRYSSSSDILEQVIASRPGMYMLPAGRCYLVFTKQTNTVTSVGGGTAPFLLVLLHL